MIEGISLTLVMQKLGVDSGDIYIFGKDLRNSLWCNLSSLGPRFQEKLPV